MLEIPVLENDHLVWCSIAVVDSDNADSASDCQAMP